MACATDKSLITFPVTQNLPEEPEALHLSAEDRAAYPETRHPESDSCQGHLDHAGSQEEVDPVPATSMDFVSPIGKTLDPRHGEDGHRAEDSVLGDWNVDWEPGDVDSGFICPDCGVMFTSQSLLLAHGKIHARDRLSCLGCGKVFGHRSSLIRHQNSRCIARMGSVTSASPQSSSALDVQSHHKCGICQMTFLEPQELRRHLGSHTGDQRYTCHECGRTFSCNYFLVRHQRSHSGERPFTCLECGKGFRCSSTLARHQRTHTGEQPYKCDVCTKCFSQKTSLVIHSRTHTEERPFSCSVCGSGFRSSSALIRHEHSHQQRANRTGGSGAKRSAPAEPVNPELALHGWEDHFTREAPVNPEITERSTDPSDGGKAESVPGYEVSDLSEDTMITGHYDGFICPECGESLRSQSLLASHRKAHARGKPFTCPACDKVFAHQYTLVRHRKSYCSANKPAPRVALCGDTEIPGDVAHRYYKCGICGESFRNTNELRRHLSGHGGPQRYTCKDCGRTFTCNYFLVRHQRVHTGEQPFQCHVCHKGFSQKTSLVIHVRTHTGERPYTCQTCGNGFCSRSSLVRHLRSHRERRVRRGERSARRGKTTTRLKDLPMRPRQTSDTGDPPAGDPFTEGPSITVCEGKDVTASAQRPGTECTDCKKSFRSPLHLKIHRRTHAGGRTFSCTDCGKNFAHRSTLIRHRSLYCSQRSSKTSSNRAPSKTPRSYKCGICQDTYPSPEELKKHLGSHKGERRFRCRECGRAFSSNFYLVRHQRTHTGERPFSCPQCGKSFKCSSVLHRHQRTHTGEQPFKCDVCAKGFTQKTSLVIHLRTHTGERPFSCAVCERSFCSRSALIRHKHGHRQDTQRAGENVPEAESIKQEPPSTEDTESACADQEMHVADDRCPDHVKPSTEQSIVKVLISEKRACEIQTTKERSDSIRETPADVEDDSGFICPDCGKFFNSSTLLLDHQMLHTERKRFTCSSCGKRFGRRSSLHQHRSSHCIFRTGSGSTKSSPIPPYAQHSNHCGLCQTDFPTAKELRQHLASHRGERRYECRECGRTFNCNYFLVRHQRTHTGERPFSCPQCDKSFKCSSVLYRHQRTHTGDLPFKCEICAKGFTQKTSLVIHLRTHTGERPFSCAVCGRSFCSRSALIRHKHVHNV